MSDIDDGSSSDSGSSVASSKSTKSSRTPVSSGKIDTVVASNATASDKSAAVGLVDDFSTPTASSKKKVVRRTNLQILADNAAKASEKVVKISKSSKKMAKQSKFDPEMLSENTARTTEKVSTKQGEIEASAAVTHVTVNGVSFPLQAAKTVWTAAETVDLIKVLCISSSSKHDVT